MLFNSYTFIFGFLPIALLGFYLLGELSRDWARRWLIGVSLFFYAWWRPINVLLMLPSVAINYGLARALQKLGSERPGAAKAVLLSGVAFNLMFLGYFKYFDFAKDTLNAAFGTNLVLTHLILPLGISFITFQKIAFLVDVHAGRVKSFSLMDYALFVLFFPQLTAGPIVHYREMMPQLKSATCRYSGENMAVGATLFLFGLFKKVVLADSIAPHVTAIYHNAATSGTVSGTAAWLAALGFMAQIYFDFSGYSDMALGLARCFGIKLPMNFNSPLKASSIIDFWQRWHASLTRFLTLYIYNPLLLAITRRRMAQNLPMLKGVDTTLGAFLSLLIVPTVITMFLSGLWHGAGFQFIIFGLLHGSYLCINHLWRMLRPSIWPDMASYQRFMKPIGWAITFIAVVSAQVFFRAPSVSVALSVLGSMCGVHGGTPAPEAQAMTGLLAILLFIALVPPNTLQILVRFEPALGFRPPAAPNPLERVLVWSPSMRWVAGVAAVGTFAILSLSALSEFLYWQF